MRRVLKQRMRLGCIVTLKNRVAYQGVLFDHDDQAIVLRNAVALSVGAEGTPVDGELIVFVSDVDTIQLV